MGMRLLCARCRTEKPESDFHRRRDNGHGRPSKGRMRWSSICRQCAKLKKHAFHERNETPR